MNRDFFEEKVKLEIGMKEGARYLWDLELVGEDKPIRGMFIQPTTDTSLGFVSVNEENTVFVGEPHKVIIIPYDQVTKCSSNPVGRTQYPLRLG